MRHLMVRARLGDAEVLIGVEIESSGYSPDLIDDVANRVTRTMKDLTGSEPEDNGEAAVLAAMLGGTHGG
jgi:hypothetical protein